MPPAADAAFHRTALLTIEAAGYGYALPGDAVLALEHVRDWTGEPPLDVLGLLGLPPPHVEEVVDSRVAVVASGERRRALLVRGRLTLMHPRADELLELPAALQPLTPLISHVAVVNGKPTFYVLSPAQLARAGSVPSPRPAPIASR